MLRIQHGVPGAGGFSGMGGSFGIVQVQGASQGMGLDAGRRSSAQIQTQGGLCGGRSGCRGSPSLLKAAQK